MGILLIALLGGFFGLFLGIAAKKFSVIKEERLEAIEALLPGVNCGGCGFVGCSDYAKGVVDKGAKPDLCTPGGNPVAEKIASLMGVKSSGVVIRYVAKVLCQGNHFKTIKKYELDTVLKTCEEASLFFYGDKSCIYGCLGYGDCTLECPFEAITVNEQGIAVVDPHLCIGCGKCVASCPKRIIQLQEVGFQYSVCCISKENAIYAKQSCGVACIACGQCVKFCPENAIKLLENLAVIDYTKCNNCGICALKCPTDAIYSDIKDISKYEVEESLCIGCTKCKRQCPVDAISGEMKEAHIIHHALCIGCGLCEQGCPTRAITAKI